MRMVILPLSEALSDAEIKVLRRREEIKALLLRVQYGRMPPAPERVTGRETARENVLDGAAVERRITLTMGPDPELNMRLTLTTPSGAGPFPSTPMILRGWLRTRAWR